MWFVIFVIVIFYKQALGQWKCTEGSETDCALNGVCINGHCSCDKGWIGDRCGQLNLGGMDPNLPGYYNKSMPTWYGSIVKENGRPHLFAVARAEDGPDDYFCNSALARLEPLDGTSIQGPYAFREWVLPRFAHEARALRAPDGTILIFSVQGLSTDIPMWDTYRCNLLHNTSYPWSKLKLTLSTSSSVFGPWNHTILWHFEADGYNDPYCRMEAPVATFFPNGTVLLVFNAFPCPPVSWKPSVDQLYMATAPHWSGPYKRRRDLGPIVHRGAHQGAEDPFVWRSKRGYHLLMHAMPGGGNAALAYSKAGVNWTVVPGSDTNNPVYPSNIKWSNGSTTVLDRRQAPYLLLSDDGDGTPLFLFTGVDTAQGHGCHWRTAWTAMQPILHE